ncbi:hypothetical protein [Hyphomicrobium sp.]|uniref:hypothetical protein n=1 Tax=Hyphomicrobium sp. TaxID=82 RepID=UPI0025B7E342|nr:hypothetical protein [Hyphomicrobium sp.]MCC7251851.1 hypothetical protein [Hyphomicrobium sp.]
MQRSTLIIIIAAFAVLGGAVLLAQNDRLATSVSDNEGTRVEAPGTRVETDRDSTRIQAPGVDITVPRDKSGD